MTSVSTEQPKTLGRYRLLDQLATGGMAVVHLAIEHGSHGLERPVVIKQLQASHDDESSQRMLLQEARLAARINHPNVVQIYDFGSHEGVYFIAMEYIDGIDLRQLFKRAREAERAAREAEERAAPRRVAQGSRILLEANALLKNERYETCLPLCACGRAD